MKSVLLLALSLWAAQLWARAPLLDRPYPNLQHPTRDLTPLSQRQYSLPAKSDLDRILRHVTSVKNQEDRGTCSIFSATALLEAMMVIEGKADHNIDMSEEWLQYLTTLTVSEEGSDSPANFRLLKKYGQPLEHEMPYVGTDWRSKEKGLAAKRCGHLPRGPDLRSCLISHRDRALMGMGDLDLLNPISHLYDPEFVNARASARRFRDLLFERGDRRTGLVRSVNAIHRLLADGIPMTMEFDFYYGSWNHPEAEKLDIHRSSKLWRQGAVVYPDEGSADLAYSKKSPSGHSVLVVGYDNSREITYWVNKKDGPKQKITRRGVYYFKNSWGIAKKGDWGSEFEIEGVRYPGYGMILQDHAHDHGQFFRLDLN